METGVCATIDRGALDDTLIGNGIIADNQYRIMRNVVTGDGTVVVGGIIMASSPKIGCYYMIGDASAVNDHTKICDKVTVTEMRMVMCPISESGIYSLGTPLRPNKV